VRVILFGVALRDEVEEKLGEEEETEG